MADGCSRLRGNVAPEGGEPLRVKSEPCRLDSEWGETCPKNQSRKRPARRPWQYGQMRSTPLKQKAQKPRVVEAPTPRNSAWLQSPRTEILGLSFRNPGCTGVGRLPGKGSRWVLGTFADQFETGSAACRETSTSSSFNGDPQRPKLHCDPFQRVCSLTHSRYLRSRC